MKNETTSKTASKNASKKISAEPVGPAGFPEIVAPFGTTGVVTRMYPQDLLSAVEQSVHLWKQFCAMPEDLKKILPYSNRADGIGYELKDGSGNKGDRKENFDMTTAGVDWFLERTANIKDRTGADFTRSIQTLIKLLKPEVVDFARKIETKFMLDGFAEEVEESGDSFFVRFIHYFGDRKPGEETASAHVDQSAFTFHLFESDPGLECLTYGAAPEDRRWVAMPVSSGETVVIPAMQLQLRSVGKLRALCHRVVATEKTAITGRYSAVCFIQLKNTPKYNKDLAGRLQEKLPGFNYMMPIGEFSQLFGRS